MIKYNDIRSVHLEISTRCNAACPDCLRNYRGVDIIETYPVCDMSLEQVKQLFPVEFIKQLKSFLINGNYGDFVTARDGLAIVEYIMAANPDIHLGISTNASAKPKMWQRLGELGITVYFRLDGLHDTHKLYRVNTDFDFIINNAKKFIAAGDRAVWSFIPFDHNQHQITEARQMSKDLGFSYFEIVDTGRNTMPVFTPDKRLSHLIGDYRGSTDFDELYGNFLEYQKTPENAVMSEKVSREINCYAKNKKEIYVTANGEVYPCCWLGFYPLHSIGKPSSVQLKPLIYKNNAIDYGLEQAIEWLVEIEKTWSIPTVPEGKLFGCNDNCGIRS